MKFMRTMAVIIAAAATSTAVGGLMPAYAEPSSPTTATVRPNPWYANGPFQGWGTSLAWFANATGQYGEPGSITRSSGNSVTDAKALEYGKQLREKFYTSIFGKEGLGLNKARFNIGGGNASDVAYGYPFMRQGAAVPGYWAEDPDGSKGLYGGVTTKQSDGNALDQAFDPASEDSYVWGPKSSKSDAAESVQAQEWWLKRGVKNGDITHLEAFANSAPWFMTEDGYATGGFRSGDNNLKDPEKFAAYMASVVSHLDQLKADNGKKVKINTVEPLNESETAYWGTPGGRASDAWSRDQQTLITRYWDRYYADKDKSVTPYSNAVKKPQEGMHVDNAQAQQTILALAKALKSEGLKDVKVSATDATDSGQFVDSYNQYPQNVRDAIGQYNTHSYGTNRQRVARDIAQGDGKVMSMSEVDGSWQGGGFNPYGFDNGLGMAGKINSDVYALQSLDFTFWQVVEDLYNMSTGDQDVNGHQANPRGENTNWGTVLIDFDCTVAGSDGKLYSERAVDNNGGTTRGIKPCSVVVNSKYNAVRAYTHFIHEGDSILANDATKDNMTARSADGRTQTIIHRNDSDNKQRLIIDLSNYGNIDKNASGKLFLTTAPESKSDPYEATMDYMNGYSNQERPGAVHIDTVAKTATVELPARSIASIQLSGVSGQSNQAGVQDGESYQLVGQQSGRALQTGSDGSLTIENPAADSQSGPAQTFVYHQVKASRERPELKLFMITDPTGKKILNDQGRMVAGSIDTTNPDPRQSWIFNTEDGTTWSMVNAASKNALEVSGQATAAGSPVGLYSSNGGENQAWTLRSTKPSGVQQVYVQARKGGHLTMPTTVTPYYPWGLGSPVPVQWDTSMIDINKEGRYQVTGQAVDVFGNSIACKAEVYIGDFTVTDPVSVTLMVGASLQQVEDAIKAAPVHAHVGASEAMDADRTAVKWDFSQLDGQLADAHAGDRLTVKGRLGSVGDGGLPVTASVYLMQAKEQNIADTSSNLTVTDQQTEYGKAEQWKKLTDGDTSAEAWVTWNSAGDYSHKPTATLDFGQERDLGSLVITYGDHAPISALAEYSLDGRTWLPLGAAASPKPGQTVTFKGNAQVKARQARIVNTVQGDFMNASEIQAWAIPKADPVHNIAPSSSSHFKVNVQEGSTAAKAIDGDSGHKGWSTWNQAGIPVATFTFDNLQSISEVKTTFFRDGRASWPKSQTLEYQDDKGVWQRVGVKSGWYVQPGSGADTSTDEDTPVADFRMSTPIVAKALRLTNTLQDTGVYINVAEIEVLGTQAQVKAEPMPSADKALGDLRLDGKTIDGFLPDKTDYTVQLPVGAESNPKLQAFARDTAATVKVRHVNAEESVKRDGNVLGGKDVITVKAADGSGSSEYTVNYLSSVLQKLLVTPPSKTRYLLNERLDLSGMVVKAVYSVPNEEPVKVDISINDPELLVSGFDSAQPGRKNVTVTYRGGSATFQVDVVDGNVGNADSQPGSGRGPGALANAKQEGGSDGSSALSQTGANVMPTILAIVVCLLCAGSALAAARRHLG